jgi:hypothetical protein
MADIIDNICPNYKYAGLSIRVVPGTFTCLKWSMIPPAFKECCVRYSWKLFQF